MPENTELQIANTLAAELANENLQLRQVVIRLRLENEALRGQGESDEGSE